MLFPLLLLSTALAAPLQPEGRDVVAHDRRVDIQHLELDLAVDVMAGTVSGTATHTALPLRAGLEEVVFHQVGLDVQSVTVDNAPTTFTVEPNLLRVAVPPTQLDTPLTLVTTYTAAPTNGLHFRRAAPNGEDDYDEVWSQGEATDHRHWFPGWDAPDDRFTFAMIASVEDRFTAVSNGTLRGKAADPQRPGWTRWHWALGGGDIVNYLVALAVAEYERGQTTWRGRPIMWFTPPGTDPEVAAGSVGRTTAMLDLFSEATGVEYPYDAYNQIFVQRFLYTGMENSGATIMDERVLSPADSFSHRRYTDVIVSHELAHQWYGDQLTCRNWREMWLNEGFANFFEGYWGEVANGPVDGASIALGRYAGQVRADDKTLRPLVVDFYNRPDDGRGSNPYGKGASVLQMLRGMLGEDAFWRGIRTYTQRHQNQSVETSNLRRAFEDSTGLALDWFFDQWVFSPGHPKLSISAKADAEAKTVRVSLKQTQNKDWQTFTLPVDVEVATTAGSSVHRVWMDSRDAAAVLPIEGDLLYVAADPKAALLADVTIAQSPAAWTALLTGTEHPYSKLHALKTLGDVSPDEGLRAAVHALVHDPQIQYRRAAAELLGEWAQEADVAVLLAALEAEEIDVVRRSFVDALGGVPSTAAVVDAVANTSREDASFWVRAGAIGALVKLEGEVARRRLFPLLRDGKDPIQRVEGAAARALGKVGRVSDLDALAALRSPGNGHRPRMAAWDASVALVKKAPVSERAALRKPLARQVVKMLEDDHLRVRQKAVYLLRSLGDERSIGALRALRGRENVESLRTSIDKTIEAIAARKEVDPDPTDAAVQAKLEALEERLEAAEEELRKVQERY